MLFQANISKNTCFSLFFSTEFHHLLRQVPPQICRASARLRIILIDFFIPPESSLGWTNPGACSGGEKETEWTMPNGGPAGKQMGMDHSATGVRGHFSWNGPCRHGVRGSFSWNGPCRHGGPGRISWNASW